MIMTSSLFKRSLLSATLLSLPLVSGLAHAGEWDIDPTHSSATFSVKHMMVSTVRGEFEKMTGTVNLDDATPSKSTVEIVIDANTINTRNAQRDAHLKSPDFFDAAKFPTLTFKSTKIDKAGKGKFKVTGDLTMHGVTKPLTLEVEGPTAAVKDMMGRQVRGVSAKGKLSRKDWGLTWNKALEAGSVVVGDEIQIQIDAELVAKAALVAPAPPAAKPAK
jgi:polyisoprenoid-binding protein YceI